MCGIIVKDMGNCITLQVIGRLSGSLVRELESRWLAAARARQCIQVDVRKATFVEEPAKELLTRMFSEGVELLVGSHREEPSHDEQAVPGTVTVSH